MGTRATAVVEQLQTLATRVSPMALAGDQVLPVGEAVRPLFLSGVRRGAAIGLRGNGATSLALAILAAPTTAGSWAAAVGIPSLGVVAAGEAGVALERLALVPDPRDRWADVVAALVDAVDVVLIAPHRRDVRATTARRLTARIRERGTVLIVIGDHWPEVPDISLMASAARWEGVGMGDGHLGHRAVDVVVSGRRGAARERRITIEFDAS